MFACVLVDEASLMATIKLACPVVRNCFPNCSKNTVLLRKVCNLWSLCSVSATRMGKGERSYTREVVQFVSSFTENCKRHDWASGQHDGKTHILVIDDCGSMVQLFPCQVRRTQSFPFVTQWVVCFETLPSLHPIQWYWPSPSHHYECV